MTTRNGSAAPGRARRHHIDRRAAAVLQSQTQILETGDQALSTRSAADLLGVSHKTLELMRFQGCGPKYLRLAPRMIRYMRSDLFAWLRERAALTQHPD